MKRYIGLFLLSLVLLSAGISSCKKDNNTSCKVIRLYSTDSFNRSDLQYTDGRLSRLDNTLKTGASQGYTLYYYSSAGVLTGYEDLDSNGVILRKTEYLLNAQNQVTRENYYVRSGSALPLSQYYLYEYHSSGERKKITRYNTLDIVMESTSFLEYDDRGNVAKGTYNNNLGIATDTFICTYDDHPDFQAIFPYRWAQNTNNVLTIVEKPTGGGSSSSNTYTYRYNNDGLVTYQRNVGEGEEYFVDYACE